MRGQLREPLEAFSEQHYEPGERFEFDYGECKLKIDGKVRKLYIAVVVAPASGIRFAKLCTDMKTEGFLNTQIDFFEYVGGTFKEGVYDNMRNAVCDFEKNRHKEFSCELLKLATYYGFGINVTNIAAGNEKGTVENAVDAIRNAAFAPQYEFDSIAEAQACLEVALEFMNTEEMFAHERKGLSPLPPRYQPTRGKFKRRVNKLCCINVANSRYSVPDDLVGEEVEVHLYDNECRVRHGDKEVACHEVVERGETAWEIRHFLHTLRNKPGSIHRSKALRANPLLKAVFDSLYIGEEELFVEVVTKHAEMSDIEIAHELLKVKIESSHSE